VFVVKFPVDSDPLGFPVAPPGEILQEVALLALQETVVPVL
jgi:hypothetical protein